MASGQSLKVPGDEDVGAVISRCTNIQIFVSRATQFISFHLFIELLAR